MNHLTIHQFQLPPVLSFSPLARHRNGTVQEKMLLTNQLKDVESWAGKGGAEGANLDLLKQAGAAVGSSGATGVGWLSWLGSVGPWGDCEAAQEE